MKPGSTLPSKYFVVLQTFDKKHLAKVKNDGYESHLNRIFIKCFMYTVY